MYNQLILLSLLVVSAVGALKDNFVSSVSQNYDERLNGNLNQHVIWYLKLEHAFNAYSSFYNRSDVALPGFSGFFKKSGQHYRDKALGMTRRINMRGGFYGNIPKLGLNDVCRDIRESLEKFKVTPANTRKMAYICKMGEPQTKSPKKKSHSREKWLAGLYGLEDALAVEKSDAAKVYRLISEAITVKDIQVKHFLEHDFLAPDRIKSLGDLVKRLRGYDTKDYSLQEYMMDLELGS